MTARAGALSAIETVGLAFIGIKRIFDDRLGQKGEKINLTEAIMSNFTSFFEINHYG